MPQYGDIDARQDRIIRAVVRRRVHRAAPAEGAQPVRVPLVYGQSARGLRTAISRAATSRGLSVETVEGDGFVAVRKTDQPRSRKGKSASSPEGQRRRGRPPKRREQDAAEIASLRDLAAGES
jgi:hypothetical protein